jgi:two-component system, NtrC family, nitrogen regulation response regulator NtrX
MYEILVVDDEINITKTIKEVLEDYGFSVITLNEGSNTLGILNVEDVDLVLLDLLMPSVNGIEILKEIRKQFPMLPVVMISGHGTISSTVECMKLGAFDFIEKPISIDKLVSTVKNALKFRELEFEKSSYWSEYKLVGESEHTRNVLELIDKIADSDASVLITGENGVGKEVVARLIHLKSSRRGEPFVDINCAAIPETLMESELFGYERGAFTGAISSKKGKIESANGGTLFLDEIAEMPLSLQSKILRVLQEKFVYRLGSNKGVQVDVRFIFSTNRDLKTLVKEGKFREDLYYRINVIPIHILPLRERKEDIIPIAVYYLNAFSTKYGKKGMEFSDEVKGVFLRYSWPGNVRELRNIVERLVIMSKGGRITLDEVREYTSEILVGGYTKDGINFDLPYRDAKSQFEKIYFQRMIAKVGNSITELSKSTGLDRTYLYRKLESLGIQPEEIK